MKRIVIICVIVMFYIGFYIYGAVNISKGTEITIKSPKKITPPDKGEYGLKNINDATVDDIDNVYNFGVKLSESIIEYRDKYGDFKGMEDLVDIPGIGEARYKSLRKEFSLSGE
ncbi:MAG: helix-hairpin-helix domain-containing protein [Ruminococcaceae bacterium]|nr:helix-hairpin-helix domain-containing protein [Oscillospiraceae bacterium]